MTVNALIRKFCVFISLLLCFYFSSIPIEGLKDLEFKDALKRKRGGNTFLVEFLEERSKY